MKLSELLKVISKYQNIAVYKNGSFIYKGEPKKLIDENILERKIKDVFTLYDEIYVDNEIYIIITLY